MHQSQSLNLKGMSCAACASRIQRTVTALSGVEQAQVNLLKNSMHVSFDPQQISLDQIIYAIERMGYGASLAKSLWHNSASPRSGSTQDAAALSSLNASDVYLGSGNKVEFSSGTDTYIEPSDFLVRDSEQIYELNDFNVLNELKSAPVSEVHGTDSHADPAGTNDLAGTAGTANFNGTNSTGTTPSAKSPGSPESTLAAAAEHHLSAAASNSNSQANETNSAHAPQTAQAQVTEFPEPAGAHVASNSPDAAAAASDSTASASPDQSNTSAASAAAPAAANSELDAQEQALAHQRHRLYASIALTLPLFYLSMGKMWSWPLPEFLSGFAHTIDHALLQALLAFAVMYLNRNYFTHGFKALWYRTPNMDSLIALGSGAAALFSLVTTYQIAAACNSDLAAYLALAEGQALAYFPDGSRIHDLAHNLYYESAAMILTLISLGKYFEARAKGKTSQALSKLMSLIPQQATVLRNGQEVLVPIEQVALGDLVVVKAGAQVPVDGVIIEGYGLLDESALTGESLPVDKQVGSQVTGATVNTDGHFIMRTERIGEDTTLAQIITIMDEATSSAAPIARIADKISGIFVPVVMGIALLTLVVWLLCGASVAFALTCSVAVLVISCPCALGLATPTAIMVGTGQAAQHGILFKSASIMERTGSIDTVVLDKTGTVTTGKMHLKAVICLQEDQSQSSQHTSEPALYTCTLPLRSDSPDAANTANTPQTNAKAALSSHVNDSQVSDSQVIESQVNDSNVALQVIKSQATAAPAPDAKTKPAKDKRKMSPAFHIASVALGSTLIKAQPSAGEDDVLDDDDSLTSTANHGKKFEVSLSNIDGLDKLNSLAFQLSTCSNESYEDEASPAVHGERSAEPSAAANPATAAAGAGSETRAKACADPLAPANQLQQHQQTEYPEHSKHTAHTEPTAPSAATSQVLPVALALLSQVAALEQYSAHPLSQAIVSAVASLPKDMVLPQHHISNFTNLTGQGLIGMCHGERLAVGNDKLLAHLQLPPLPTLVQEKVQELSSQGHTILYCVRQDKVVGLLALADTLQEHSAQAVALLKELPVELMLLTGDHQQTAQHIAQQAGIDKVVAQVMPQDKAMIIKQLQAQGKKVAMVGDGINDAPALAQADVGIAIGAGSDIALEAADVVLVKSELTDVVVAMQLSRSVLRNIKENLFWAFIYNTIGIPIAAGVFFSLLGWTLSPMLAAAAMSFSSVSVVSNALRLRRFKPQLQTTQDLAKASAENTVRHTPAAATAIDAAAASQDLPNRLTPDVATADGTQLQLSLWSVLPQSHGDLMSTKCITIEGMSCQHCVKAVTKALQAIAGVSDVKVDLESKQATLQASDQVSDEQLKQAITEADFKVVSID